MNFLKKLFGFGNKSTLLSNKELIEASACPNCWGSQEYDGKYKEFIEDSTKSNINHDKQNQKAFIAQFVETHVTGIQLKKDGDYSICPNCRTKY